MEKLTEEQIREVRQSVDIIDVVSSYMPLIPKGKNYFGVCPFHDDHSPSMSVSKDKQIYTCFSCGASGNVINFVMDYEHISFLEAVKKLSLVGGIDININVATPIKQHSVLYDIYELSIKLYQNNLNTKEGLLAKEYLKQRNIDEEIIKVFGIGLALKNHDLLTKMLVKKKYSEKDIINSGLVIKTKSGLADIYYNRIMFPLSNLDGQTVGYSGRIYNGEDISKYVNTKETEIFKKGELLFNYHRARDEARMQNRVIVMEGFMDVIRAYTVGIKNVVATMGTAVTKKQAGLIKRMAKEIILCFDGDTAGAKATSSCIDLMLELGVNPKIVRLEDNLDPDEYITKYGKQSFLDKIEKAINIIDFKTSYYRHDKDMNNNEDMAKYVSDVINEISKIDDDVYQELSLNKLSKESGLDIAFLKSKLKKNIKPASIKKTKKEVTVISKYQKAEQNLIFYMLRSIEVIKMYNVKIVYMPTPVYQRLACHISYYYKTYKSLEIADLITSLNNNEELKQALNSILSLNLKEEYTKEEINDYINVIKEYSINHEKKKLLEAMKKESDPLKKAEIAEKMRHLILENNEE